MHAHPHINAANGSGEVEQIECNSLFFFFFSFNPAKIKARSPLADALWRFKTSLLGLSQRADLPRVKTNTQDGIQAALLYRKRGNGVLI